MNEATLALCKKPVIGIAMWLSSMCVTNQALKDTFIDISKDSVVLEQAIDIPMDERYLLMLSFRSGEKYDPDNPSRSFRSYFCPPSSEKVEAWKSPSRRLVLAIEVVGSDGRTTYRKQVEPACDLPSGNPNYINLGYIDMKRGKYRLTINNLYPVSIEREGRVQAILRGSGAGYP